jgi:tetratricopeptide (TPR) repeat protein
MPELDSLLRRSIFSIEQNDSWHFQGPSPSTAVTLNNQVDQMPQKHPTHSKSFGENIDILLDELKLAIQWDRPSILLTVHNSKHSQNKAQKVLEVSLNKIGQAVINIIVNTDSADIPKQILQTQGNKGKIVFFISNIDWGGGENGKNSYNALNLYREFFVEQKIRIIIWLTKNEEANLSRYAPDFWAFRHRVIEFASTHQPQNIKPCVGILNWHIQPTGDSAQTLREKISFRAGLLKELPDAPEAQSTRLELHYTLGFLYWNLGDDAKARAELAAGWYLLGSDGSSSIKSWILNGQAILDYDLGEYQKAYAASSELVHTEPLDSILWMNLSVVLCALGKNHEAIIQSKKAIQLAPTNAKLWNSLGYLCISMEKLEDASVCFKKAIEIAPSNATFSEALAICYSRMGLLDESLRQMYTTNALGGDRKNFRGIYEKAILGKTNEALAVLRVALQAGQISKAEIQHDPSMNVLLDPSALQAIF